MTHWGTRFGTRTIAPSPWQEMARLQADMQPFFGVLERLATREFPRVNVDADEDGARVIAELPGVAASDVELTVEGDTLTIQGKRAEAAPAEGGTQRLRERETGAFVRTIQLPFNIEADAVQAVHKHGLLEIELPRAASERPKKIAVHGAAQPEGESS
jgi:HSP20 family protein